MGGSLSFPKVDLKGKVVVVTGGNTGIGFETAKWIAMMGAKVIIACRSEERAKKAIESMQDEYKMAKDKKTQGICSEGKLNVEFMPLDCSSLKSASDFVNNFTAKEEKLNILICNAGIALHPQEYTDEGFEKMFQVNYLSHFLIALKLLPMMKRSGDDCRLIQVSSDAHLVSNFNMEKIQGRQFTKDSFDRLTYYGNSKLYQIMQMYSMNEQLLDTNVTVNSIHPGIVDTEINRSFNDLSRWKFFFFLSRVVRVTKTPYEGATTLIKAAVSPEYKGARNNYYVNCTAKTANETARNKKYQAQLWEYTLDCLKDYIDEKDLAEIRLDDKSQK